MRRESDDGFLCGVCLETVYRGECKCVSFRDGRARDTLDMYLEACWLNYKRLHASNDTSFTSTLRKGEKHGNYTNNSKTGSPRAA